MPLGGVTSGVVGCERSSARIVVGRGKKFGPLDLSVTNFHSFVNKERNIGSADRSKVIFVGLTGI